jgi:glutamate-1-semialdehyde aminotransferase
MSMAIRLARAQTGKDIVAFSGYHGWHDWYLAANIKNKNTLDKHLLPGLDPIGVPKKLKNSIISIEYNNIQQLEKLKKKSNIAAIVIEGYRYQYPSKAFLKKIQAMCKENKICLIVDEITSGWRETVGGVYKKLNIRPDIVVYGKAIGNGYAISSILGKKKFMIYGNKSFISSTAWTEKVGFAAANATIDYFVKNKVHLHILRVAKILSLGWKNIAKKYNIKLRVSEVLPICSFFLDYPNREELYTFFTKEMLNKNYLANNSVWISFAHKEKDIKKYLKNCNIVFKKMSNFINNRKKFGKFEIRYSSLVKL